MNAGRVQNIWNSLHLILFIELHFSGLLLQWQGMGLCVNKIQLHGGHAFRLSFVPPCTAGAHILTQFKRFSCESTRQSQHFQTTYQDSLNHLSYMKERSNPRLTDFNRLTSSNSNEGLIQNIFAQKKFHLHPLELFKRKIDLMKNSVILHNVSLIFSCPNPPKLCELFVCAGCPHSSLRNRQDQIVQIVQIV